MNIPDRLKEFYSRLTGSKKAMTAAAAVGIAGMLMILFFGGNENEEPKETIVTEPAANVWTDYCSDTERRLEELLSAIDGVGDVKVMISFSSTEEYIYAQAEKINGEKTENEYVTVRNGNSEEALLRQVNTPAITGVAVVCGGGKSDRVREEIYRTVTAVLGIPAGRIYVAAME